MSLIRNLLNFLIAQPQHDVVNDGRNYGEAEHDPCELVVLFEDEGCADDVLHDEEPLEQLVEEILEKPRNFDFVLASAVYFPAEIHLLVAESGLLEGFIKCMTLLGNRIAGWAVEIWLEVLEPPVKEHSPAVHIGKHTLYLIGIVVAQNQYMRALLEFNFLVVEPGSKSDRVLDGQKPENARDGSVCDGDKSHECPMISPEGDDLRGLALPLQQQPLGVILVDGCYRGHGNVGDRLHSILLFNESNKWLKQTRVCTKGCSSQGFERQHPRRL